MLFTIFLGLCCVLKRWRIIIITITLMHKKVTEFNSLGMFYREKNTILIAKIKTDLRSTYSG